MNYYQACCLLVFTILGTAIIIDPVTQFVFANPFFIARRFFFALWYMFWTEPFVLFKFTDWFPMTAMEFYLTLLTVTKKSSQKPSTKTATLLNLKALKTKSDGPDTTI